MKILAFTDTHGNDDALKFVAKLAKQQKVDIYLETTDTTIIKAMKTAAATPFSSLKPILLPMRITDSKRLGIQEPPKYSAKNPNS